MDLSHYTDEELRAELRRRSEARKALADQVPRCKNCQHFQDKDIHRTGFCMIHKWYHKQRKVEIPYVVSRSKEACEDYDARVFENGIRVK